MNDSSETPPTAKISRGDAGLGTVSPEMVEERAAELARTDGRTQANESHREAARAELLGPARKDAAPETVDSETEGLVEWDTPLESTGHRAPRVRPEDEASIAETLIEEGLEEADHSQRLSAAEENPPEEG